MDKDKDKEKESKNTTAKFPPPPKHYKLFETPNSISPPSTSTLNKLTSFKTFGVEYKIKDVNNFFNQVEVHQLLETIPQDYLNTLSISNQLFFQNLNDNIVANQNFLKINSDDLNFNIIKELENEIRFVKERYKSLLVNVTKRIDYCQYDSNLIKLSFQKIFFYLSLLKKKKILNDITAYFDNEIKQNEIIEERLIKNINLFQTILLKGIQDLRLGKFQ